jgi:hypothetical protein
VSQVRPHAEFDVLAPEEAVGEESRAQLRRLAPPALTAPRPASSRLFRVVRRHRSTMRVRHSDWDPALWYSRLTV